MVQIWPLSVFYRAYFGTMKFKERFAFCLCIFCLLVPFFWLRWKVSDDHHPLMLSVSDTQSLVDGMDFNRIDHTHRHQRSNDETPSISSQRLPRENQHLETVVGKEPVLDEKHDNVDVRDESERKNANDDVDYEYDDPWTLWKGMVKSRQVTSPGEDDSMNMILEAMMYKPIVAAGVGYRGTQLKATFILEGKQRVVFKPMR